MPLGFSSYLLKPRTVYLSSFKNILMGGFGSLQMALFKTKYNKGEGSQGKKGDML
jgi:hypothetical protein